VAAAGAGAGIIRLRTTGHPGRGRVPRSRFDPTATGFVLEVEEEWEAGGESWYCRELWWRFVIIGRLSPVAG
jgi:hypothetical protein